MHRRSFLHHTAALSTAALLPSSALAYRHERDASLRASCVSWCFHGFGAGVDTTAAIPTVAGLGFDGIQLMVNAYEDLVAIWTSEKVAATRRRLESVGLALTSLAPFYPCYPHLGHADDALREESLAAFGHFCRLARKLGTDQIEVLSPYLSEFSDLGNDLFQAPYGKYAISGEDYVSGSKITLGSTLGDASAASSVEVDWAAITRRMDEVFARMATHAEAHGLTIVMEPHIHGYVAETAGFLLAKARGLPEAFALNSDTGWGTQQAEYPAMTVYRAAGHLRIMQFRDVGPDTRTFASYGEGVVDMDAVFAALRAVGFAGWLSFEEVFFDTVAEDAARFLAAVRDAGM